MTVATDNPQETNGNYETDEKVLLAAEAIVERLGRGPWRGSLTDELVKLSSELNLELSGLTLGQIFRHAGFAERSPNRIEGLFEYIFHAENLQTKEQANNARQAYYGAQRTGRAAAASAKAKSTRPQSNRMEVPVAEGYIRAIELIRVSLVDKADARGGYLLGGLPSLVERIIEELKLVDAPRPRAVAETLRIGGFATFVRETSYQGGFRWYFHPDKMKKPEDIEAAWLTYRKRQTQISKNTREREAEINQPSPEYRRPEQVTQRPRQVSSIPTPTPTVESQPLKEPQKQTLHFDEGLTGRPAEAVLRPTGRYESLNNIIKGMQKEIARLSADRQRLTDEKGELTRQVQELKRDVVKLERALEDARDPSIAEADKLIEQLGSYDETSS